MDNENFDVPGLKQRRTKAGIQVLSIHYTADPARRSEEWKKHERRKYSSQAAWDREQEIVHGGRWRRAALPREILNRWGHKIIISGEGLVISPFWRAIGGFDHGLG